MKKIVIISILLFSLSCTKDYDSNTEKLLDGSWIGVEFPDTDKMTFDTDNNTVKIIGRASVDEIYLPYTVKTEDTLILNGNSFHYIEFRNMNNQFYIGNLMIHNGSTDGGILFKKK